MKLIKIFLILSLVIFSFARVSRKNEAKLNSKSLALASSTTEYMALGPLQKQYGGDIQVNGRDGTETYLAADKLRRIHVKGLVFRTKDLGDITNANISKYLVKITNGIYYLPYISTAEFIFFDSGCCTKDYIYTYVNKRVFKFTFWFGSWNKGSGESLNQKINEFRTRRIIKTIARLKLLSRHASRYVTAKQGNVAAASGLSGVDTQISTTTVLVTTRTTLRQTDLATAESFVSLILTAQTELAELRKQLLVLNTTDAQKNGLITQLTNAIVQFNAQKVTASATAGDQFKADLDANNQNFVATIALLKEEAVSDTDKLDKASDALIKENNLDTCTTILKTIMP